MFDKLQAAENRYEEINHKLVDPEVIGDQNEYRKLMKEHSDLEEIVAKYGEYKKLNKEIEEAKELWVKNWIKNLSRWLMQNLRKLKDALKR